MSLFRPYTTFSLSFPSLFSFFFNIYSPLIFQQVSFPFPLLPFFLVHSLLVFIFPSFPSFFPFSPVSLSFLSFATFFPLHYPLNFSFITAAPSILTDNLQTSIRRIPGTVKSCHHRKNCAGFVDCELESLEVEGPCIIVMFPHVSAVQEEKDTRSDGVGDDDKRNSGSQVAWLQWWVGWCW